MDEIWGTDEDAVDPFVSEQSIQVIADRRRAVPLCEHSRPLDITAEYGKKSTLGRSADGWGYKSVGVPADADQPPPEEILCIRHHAETPFDVSPWAGIRRWVTC